MKVLKFGGSSLANADKFLSVANIVLNENKKSPVSVVLSAPQGVTNLLVSLLDCLESDSEPAQLVEELQSKIQQIERQLIENLNTVSKVIYFIIDAYLKYPQHHLNKEI